MEPGPHAARVRAGWPRRGVSGGVADARPRIGSCGDSVGGVAHTCSVPGDQQLSWIPDLRVRVEYHPLAAPPDQGHAGDLGVFLAGIGDPGPQGWWRDASSAIRVLALQLRRIGREAGPGSGVSALSQGFAAAERLELDEFHDWLLSRAEQPTLHEPSDGPVFTSEALGSGAASEPET